MAMTRDDYRSSLSLYPAGSLAPGKLRYLIPRRQIPVPLDGVLET